MAADLQIVYSIFPAGFLKVFSDLRADGKSNNYAIKLMN
jgi:hypothetical protein